MEYLKGNKDFIVIRNGREEISAAAILLFGKYPQRFFQRARVRFIRYDGTEAKVGVEMNVIKDEIFEGKILEVVEQTIHFVRSQIREHFQVWFELRILEKSIFHETQRSYSSFMNMNT